MRCIDTPLLQDLLLGRSRAKRWLEKVTDWGGELAATEVSIVELSLLAKGEGMGAERHYLALESLRRELTLLPLDAEATRAIVAIVRRNRESPSPFPLLVAGSALSHGVETLLTDRRRAFPRDLSPLKIIRF